MADPGDNMNDTRIVCYAPAMITTNGIWQGDNPLDYSLPLFLLQLILIVVTTRALVYVLRPLRQPRVIAEILGGVILGPTGLGRIENMTATVFPLRSSTVLETMAHLGLIYFLFLIGVETDMGILSRTGRKAFMIAVAGMFIPFLMAVSSSFFLRYYMVKDDVAQLPFLLFLGVVLSITAFPVLARILAELKLLNSELGRLAMSSAIINDILGYVLLALSIQLADHNKNPVSTLWVFLSMVGYVFFCIYVVRPLILWIIRHTPEGETIDELYICIIMAGVLVSSFIADATGIHSIFGAFVFGLVIPNGVIGATLIEKLEDFIGGLLLPLFFATSGLKTDLSKIADMKWSSLLVGIIVLACIGKIGGTILITSLFKMPVRDGLSLGMLMNAKGLIEVIVLNVGRDQKVLDEKAFGVLVLMAVIVTSVITPVVTMSYRSARRFIPYKRRTIQSMGMDMELRMLACIHTPRNVPTIINLLEASHPTKKTPISVYILHLVELTGRASAMVVVHNPRKGGGAQNLDPTLANSVHIINAFENYEEQSVGVAVHPLTAISPYSTMHEDICNLAEDKRVSIIIVPFHKQQTVDGGMEATHPAFRTVNQNVLANAPCSVGILIDRGIGGTSRVASSHVSHHIAVLFFGGPDDREALCYAMRMAEHPGSSLTVVRFLEGDDVAEVTAIPGDESKILSVITDNEREQQLDDEFINEFRLRKVSDESVVYREEVVNNGEETVAVIRGMDSILDLYIVGRGQGMISPLTAGLTDWSECPELGAIGDLIASSDFAATVSVLVIQQYAGVIPTEVLATPDTPALQVEGLLRNDRQQAARTSHARPPRESGAYGSGWNTIPLTP